jgi:protein CpxP
VSNLAMRLALAGTLAVSLSLPLMATPQDAAQEAPPQGHHGRHGGGMMASPAQRLEHLSQQLNLSDDQKAKIKPMLEDEAQKMQALHNDTSLSRQDRRAKMMEIHQATNDQVRSVLTEDQQKKFADMQEKRKQRMSERGGQRD